jgi:hypothetical protein
MGIPTTAVGLMARPSRGQALHLWHFGEFHSMSAIHNTQAFTGAQPLPWQGQGCEDTNGMNPFSSACVFTKKSIERIEAHHEEPAKVGLFRRLEQQIMPAS